MKTIDKVKNIIEFLSASDVSEMFWEKDGLRIDLRRDVAVSTPLPPKQETKRSKAVASQTDRPMISAPIVGTFYSTHPQSHQVYIKEGSEVSVGQVIGVIEAMKVYREIHAHVNANIVEILVADGQPVMYAQDLIVIEEI